MTKKLTFFSVSKSLAISLLLAFFLFLSSCNSNKTSSDSKAIEETLRNADATIQNAIAQKNIDTLMSFYAQDACLLPTAEPKVEGKDAIKKEWQHIFAIPDFANKSQLTKVEVSDDGSMAYTMGSYLATMQGEDGKQVQEPGKWITIWKKQSDNQWRIKVDTYNTDIPPPDHK
jgi:ketosteroid isomerase-like protein